jgi:hypothetical protein
VESSSDSGISWWNIISDRSKPMNAKDFLGNPNFTIGNDLNGQITKFEYDPIEHKLVVKIKDPKLFATLKKNQEMKSQREKSWKGDIHHVASIPEVFLRAYCQERGITIRDYLNSPKEQKRLLNNPDYSFLRTKDGKI